MHLSPLEADSYAKSYTAHYFLACRRWQFVADRRLAQQQVVLYCDPTGVKEGGKNRKHTTISGVSGVAAGNCCQQSTNHLCWKGAILMNLLSFSLR